MAITLRHKEREQRVMRISVPPVLVQRVSGRGGGLAGGQGLYSLPSNVVYDGLGGLKLLPGGGRYRLADLGLILSRQKSGVIPPTRWSPLPQVVDLIPSVEYPVLGFHDYKNSMKFKQRR